MTGGFHLFVYGTLRGDRAGRLGDCVRVRDATVPGTLYDIRGEFPALMLYGDTRVRGEVWRCPLPVVKRLDEYEDLGSGLFRRVGVLVDELGCWTYVAGPGLARELTPARRIASGDWLARQ